MVNSNLIINKYKSHQAIFNQSTGFLLRLGNHFHQDPFWCDYGPELIDISITNWCDRDCVFCYKGSNQNGIHMEIDGYKKIMQQAMQMKVFQVALGGGNPNQHPDFCEILRLTHEDYNIVPSYTTNGRGLNEEVLLASKKYCGAVAVSAYKPYETLFKTVQQLSNFGIKTNIHFLLTSETINTAIQWLKNPPQIFNQINAIIFLNYKPVGRNPNPELLLGKAKNVQRFFQLAQEKKSFKIGFDSCSISGIARFMNISPIFIERCEAGRFSMYISEDMKMYPCSFMVDKIEGVPILEDNIQLTWQTHNSFTNMRELLNTNTCQECPSHDICLGGCPIFPEINVCPK